jgi:serine protease AprX
MKKIVLAISLLFPVLFGFGQVAPDKYFVKFTDKNNSPYSVENPSEFLSQRAIERRVNQGINVDEYDLPVNPAYLEGVAGTGAILLNPTKWLNGVTIFTIDPSVIEEINALPYVASISLSAKYDGVEPEQPVNFIKSFFENETYTPGSASRLKSLYTASSFDYGEGLNQIQMLNGDVFHEMGYRGEGMVIAVLDAGYINANNLSVFDSLWENDQILGTKDFVRGGVIQFDEHQHGSMVLSCMGSNVPGELIGTAPKASYWLLRSEFGDSEYIIEEYNWVSAAEFADSVGADVINSSLGYNDFWDPLQNHTYADMNGDTAPATIGADMAAKKGILVVNSLGNEGSTSWYYLSAPSDGDSVMGIGAVDPDGYYVSFSSHGPSYDGRVKPDVAAQGSSVYVVEPFGGGFTYGGGTSFSSPILAGMAACLWQANPSMTNMQIADAIRKSASQYTTPDDLLGYGIPDFVLANNILTIITGPDDPGKGLYIYPNPASGYFIIDVSQLKGTQPINSAIIEILDLTGQSVGTVSKEISHSDKIYVDLSENLSAGVYFIKLNLNGKIFTGKITIN